MASLNDALSGLRCFKSPERLSGPDSSLLLLNKRCAFRCEWRVSATVSRLNALSTRRNSIATFMRLAFSWFPQLTAKLMLALNESRERHKGFAILSAAKLVRQRTQSLSLLHRPLSCIATASIQSCQWFRGSPVLEKPP